MATYNEAVCHAGQHKKTVYIALQRLYSVISGHTQSAQTRITQFYMEITPYLPICFASIHQMAPPLSEAEGI